MRQGVKEKGVRLTVEQSLVLFELGAAAFLPVPVLSGLQHQNCLVLPVAKFHHLHSVARYLNSSCVVMAYALLSLALSHHTIVC